MSNTERLVMIPLALHTETERQGNQRERMGGRGGEGE